MFLGLAFDTSAVGANSRTHHSGGKAAKRAPEVILALVAPQSFLDLALGFTRQVILSLAKRVAMDHSLVEW